MSRHRVTARGGFSLLEILLALAILGGTLAVLSQIVGLGGDASRSARELAMARLLCQSKLSELLVSNLTPVAVVSTPISGPDSDSDTQFNYAVEIGTAPMDGLLALRVSVEAVNPDGGPAIASYSITRWIIDPLMGLEQAAADQAAGFQSSGSSGSTSPATGFTP